MIQMTLFFAPSTERRKRCCRNPAASSIRYSSEGSGRLHIPRMILTHSGEHLLIQIAWLACVWAEQLPGLDLLITL